MSHLSPYAGFMLAGLAVSIVLWSRVARSDSRLVIIYVAVLAGAFLGAKLVYLAAEGWLHWHDQDRWRVLATGKTILGGLLGGYAAVELAKRVLGYTPATGDWFALITPLALILGRIGCITQGCCLGRPCDENWFTVRDDHGVPRWPAAHMELLFNALALVGILCLRLSKSHHHPSSATTASTTGNYLLPGQHFHLYLIAYGAFRFLHEYSRDTPRILGPLSGYQIAALAAVVLGLVRFRARARSAIQPSQINAPSPCSNP